MTKLKETARAPRHSQATETAWSNMVWIDGGTFLMGSDSHYPEEAPAHKVRLDGFWIDICTVTNREFLEFVDATGYVTTAERRVDPTNYLGALPEMLAPSSVVFIKPKTRVDLGNPYNWWKYVRGANWRHPRGPASTIKGLMDHPVVHVAFEDAQAYAQWAGKELPTEAEWEFAARGGLDGADYVWGDEMVVDGRPMANTWQGEFPWQNSREDGYEGTSPVKTYPANGYGLFDMAGNVWEWTTDWYQDHGLIDSPCCTISNPSGASEDQSCDPRQPQLKIPRKVMKGGSHLCAPNYCRRYRPAARMAQPIDMATCHLGFRCIVRGNHG